MSDLELGALFENEVQRLQSEILHLKNKQKENVAEINKLATNNRSLMEVNEHLLENEKFLKKVIDALMESLEYFRDRR